MFLASHIWHFQNKQKNYNKDCYQMHLPITKYFCILYTMSCILKVPKIYKWGSMYSVGSSWLSCLLSGWKLNPCFVKYCTCLLHENPIDFDKHESKLDFVQYKVRKKQRSKAIIFFIVALTTHRLVYDQDDQFY